jgi:hypothetical protein
MVPTDSTGQEVLRGKQVLAEQDKGQLVQQAPRAPLDEQVLWATRVLVESLDCKVRLDLLDKQAQVVLLVKLVIREQQETPGQWDNKDSKAALECMVRLEILGRLVLWDQWEPRARRAQQDLLESMGALALRVRLATLVRMDSKAKQVLGDQQVRLGSLESMDQLVRLDQLARPGRRARQALQVVLGHKERWEA